jgi:DNA-binding PadR family transcriptional regulator
VVFRQFFLGFIKIHILHHAAQEPLYGLSLIEELRRHGYSLSPGTLYPILHGLTQAGYLVQQDRIVGGKVRKYYSITKAGRLTLRESRRQVVELVHEVVEHRPSPVGGRRTASSRRTRTQPVPASKRAGS